MRLAETHPEGAARLSLLAEYQKEFASKVTIDVEGGKAATFGGASTLTVATNAAGQATVSSLTPATAGAFHIQVTAAVQGQVATATIAQTNVMTAAQAAAAEIRGRLAGVAGAAARVGRRRSARSAPLGPPWFSRCLLQGPWHPQQTRRRPR